MNQLQEVLLVQLVRAQGTDAFTDIAAALRQHPLLTSLAREEAKEDNLTAESCKLAYERICEREVTENGAAKHSRQGVSIVNDVWDWVYTRYISWLKKQLRDDEEQYETLRMLTEKSSDPRTAADTDAAAAEVPSSTQETGEELSQADQVIKGQRRGSGRNLTRSIDQHDQADQGTSRDVEMTEEDDAQSSKHSVTRKASNRRSAREVDFDEQMPRSTHKDTVTETKLSVETLSEVAIESRANVDGADARQTRSRHNDVDNKVKDEDDGIDSGAQHMYSTSATPSEPIKMSEAAHESIPTPRVTRTRSSTMNTVNSDAGVTEEQESPHVVAKKRAGRPSKKQTTRENSVADASEEVQTAEDVEAAAAALKRFQSTIIPVLGSINSHRYASIFGNAVSDKDAPHYSQVIKYPMDLKTLRMHIKSGEIGNVVSFQCAIFRMLSNAVMYNSADSEVAAMAQELFDSVEDAISLYKAAEEYADPVEDRTPKRRRRNEV